MWKKIEILLAEKKMTKYELAKKAGLNQNSLIDLKKGRKKSLKFDDVVKIADVLEVSLDEFRKDNTWKAKVLSFFTKMVTKTYTFLKQTTLMLYSVASKKTRSKIRKIEHIFWLMAKKLS